MDSLVQVASHVHTPNGTWATFPEVHYRDLQSVKAKDLALKINTTITLSILPSLMVATPYARLPVELRSNLPAIRACIFDLDGLLLNTEDLYLECINIILSRYNRPLLPWSVRAKFQGRPDFADCIYRWAQLPISAEQYQTERAELQRQIFPSARPLPGVRRLLHGLQKRKVQLALATSSKRANFDLKTKHLPDVFDHFGHRKTIVGSDERIPRGRGKPHPDIFQLALRMVNEHLEPGVAQILPEECLVFEDSMSGVRAAQAAGMRCIWCPHPELITEIQKEPNEVVDDVVRQAWISGETRGVLEQVDSLEHFDFRRYGLV